MTTSKSLHPNSAKNSVTKNSSDVLNHRKSVAFPTQPPGAEVTLKANGTLIVDSKADSGRQSYASEQDYYESGSEIKL
ncbi:unnamed protein product [Anisakis simplex]|uniref:Uncharacterized protein n=1 Tax=Anisakis simplex TaxID=6269 RepID=A0A3P6NA85_ANISI|nr:unnamed protein product [Anisakis simplex]